MAILKLKKMWFFFIKLKNDAISIIDLNLDQTIGHWEMFIELKILIKNYEYSACINKN